MTLQAKDAAVTMIDNLKSKTGKTLLEWRDALTQRRFAIESNHGEIMTYLKTECGITHGFANLIALKFREPKPLADDDLLLTQYQGDKRGLRSPWI